MRRIAKLALGNVKKAFLLMSTKLRKHLAIISQILNLDKYDLEQLAIFMGHTEKTHSEYYRLPNDVYQVAKVSKLLLSKSAVLDEKYKGKSLAEIDIGNDNCLLSDNSDDQNNDLTMEADEQFLHDVENQEGNGDNRLLKCRLLQ